VLHVSDQTPSCHLRKAKNHEVYQKPINIDIGQNVFQYAIEITLKKKGLFAARIAELTFMVLTRKIGVQNTVGEELIPSPSSPTKHQGRIYKIGRLEGTQQNY
jgi:hypothetical protein